MTFRAIDPEELKQNAPTLAAAVEAALDHEATDRDLNLLALAGLTPRLPEGATFCEPQPLSIDARKRIALAALAGAEIRWVRDRYVAAVRAARTG